MHGVRFGALHFETDCALMPALELMTLGSNFASHISLSSAKDHCHCSQLPHTLIPAL